METAEATNLDAKDAAVRASGLSTMGTGSPAIDRLLGGGLRESSLVEFHGASKSGKTQLAMQVSLMAASSGRLTLYLDTEGQFRPERIEEMAIERHIDTKELLERIVYVRVNSSSEQMDAVRSMGRRSRTADCRLVVIDSITRNFSLELPGAGNLSSRQGALAVHLSEMARDAWFGRRAYLLTNRVTYSGESVVAIGGKTLGQMVDRSVRLERMGETIKATVAGTGESVTAAMNKAGVT